MVFNGRVSHTNAPETRGSEPIALTDARIHGLSSGYGFDLRSKRPLLPGGGEILW